MIDYGFTKTLAMPFEACLQSVTETLKKEGFGILTKIDVQEKFREKLGIDFKKYVILGACNPAYAHKAICAEEDVGLLLPCNVIVYERDDETVVSIIRPGVAMNSVKNEALREIALTVEEKLQRVFDAL